MSGKSTGTTSSSSATAKKSTTTASSTTSTTTTNGDTSAPPLTFAEVRIPKGSGSIGALVGAFTATVDFWVVLLQYIYQQRQYPSSESLLTAHSPSTLFEASSVLTPAWLRRSSTSTPTSTTSTTSTTTTSSTTATTAAAAPFGGDVWANVQVFSLSLIFRMWSVAPHYRSRDFQEDMINNLKNVAIPGTGIPLSVFCYSYYTALVFVLLINPLICALGAANKCRHLVQRQPYVSIDAVVVKFCEYYLQHLLHPDDWFSFWRLNCRLTSYQSMVTKCKDFDLENKWTFLVKGRDARVPVTPFLDMPELVCKHINIEGGMGIHFYRNALHGGNWVMQERLHNAKWLAALLPKNSPLSTMRVITSSSYAYRNDGTSTTSSTTTTSTTATTSTSSKQEDGEAGAYVKALTAVLRLGREGASTDHSSVLFDVDKSTGTIKTGLTNAHWYKLGLSNIYTCPWLAPGSVTDEHPDAPGVVVVGSAVPGIKEALDVCIRSHFTLLPNVPMVGWDVSFTPTGIYLLEVNLSCNFFKGSFDIEGYIAFVDRAFRYVSSLERGGGSSGSTSGSGNKVSGKNTSTSKSTSKGTTSASAVATASAPVTTPTKDVVANSTFTNTTTATASSRTDTNTDTVAAAVTTTANVVSADTDAAATSTGATSTSTNNSTNTATSTSTDTGAETIGAATDSTAATDTAATTITAATDTATSTTITATTDTATTDTATTDTATSTSTVPVAPTSSQKKKHHKK